MNNPIPMMELDRTENALRDILIQPLITPNEVGLLEVPTKPGLGIEVDEKALNKYRIRMNTIQDSVVVLKSTASPCSLACLIPFIRYLKWGIV